MKAYCEQLLATAATSPGGLVVTLEGDGALTQAKAIRRQCYALRRDRNLMLKIKHGYKSIELHIIPPGDPWGR